MSKTIELTETNRSLWVETPNGSIYIHLNKYTGLWSMTAWNRKMGENGERPTITKKIAEGCKSRRIYDIVQKMP